MPVFALAQSTAYLAVGLLALIGTLAAGYYTNKARKDIAQVSTAQAANESAITGLDHLASQLQKQIDAQQDELTEAKIEAREARTEVRSLRAENVDVKLRLDECKQSERVLSQRIAELERNL